MQALVRLSESLAKMKLMPFATEHDVDEAMRLFKVACVMDSHSSSSFNTLSRRARVQVSTLSAAAVGTPVSGSESGATLEEVLKIEGLLKRRFPVGSRISEARILADFAKQVRTRACVFLPLIMSAVNTAELL